MNFKGNPSLKNRFPFRLGTTSYILPADLLMNVEFLADRVDDIELVLFESDDMTNLPDAATVRALKETADRHDLTYTVHLPLDTWLGHEDAAVRRQSVERCLRVMERTAPLSPFAYVVHFHGDHRGPCPSLDLARWHEEHRRSVERLLDAAAPQDLCVEHLDYPFSMIEDIVSDYGLSVCLDMGHLLLYGHDPKAFLDRYLPQTRIVHLHGVVEGVDHCSLSFLPEGLLAAVVERLGNGAQKPRVVTMEIFDEGALNQSLDVMSQFVE